jgi:hypothetical protein
VLHHSQDRHFPTPAFRHRLTRSNAHHAPLVVLAVPDDGLRRALRVAVPLGLLGWAGLATCAAIAVRLLGG